MIKFAKRTDTSKFNMVMIRVCAVAAALLVSGIFLVFLKLNPFEVYLSMIKGALGTAYRFKSTVVKAVPLVVTSIGITIAFKMKFWNIGAEGQIFMGGVFASYAAFNFSFLPMPVLLLVMLIAAMLGGILCVLIPAVCRAYFGTNETLLTLMFNYVALQFVMYLQFNLWKSKASLGFPKIDDFPSNALLPSVAGLHIGFIIALVLVVAAYIFLKRSKRGYELSVIGESENTARYAGMDVKRIILTTVLMSGAVCGITGFIETAGTNGTLSIGITGGVGYTAIITAWLANLSAPLIVVVSFLFAMLVQGGEYIQTAYQIPQAAAQVLQGMILFFVLMGEFFTKYKFAHSSKISVQANSREKE